MGCETDFKRWMRSEWKKNGGWSEAYEPGSGSGVGYPDLQFLIGNRLVPVEAKMGEFRDGKIFMDFVRPSQVRWHHEFFDAGGIAFFAVGLKFDKKRGYDYALFQPHVLTGWKHGIEKFEFGVEDFSKFLVREFDQIIKGKQ